MSKPDDIPQNVWDDAVQCAAVVFEANVDLYEFGISGGDPHLIIARAIMSATGQEREACAAIIDEHMLCGDRNGAEVLLPRGTSGNEVGFAYAAAIRKRGAAP